MATEKEILLLHSQEYYEMMKSSANMSDEDLETLSHKYDAAFFNQACLFYYF